MKIYTDNINLQFIMNKTNITSIIYCNFIEYFGIYIPKYNTKDIKIYEHPLYIIDKKKIYKCNNINDNIYINIYNFGKYIKENINKIYIKTINGRFGNKLIQYCNSISFAMKYNINEIEFIDTIDFLIEKKQIISNYPKKNKYYISKYWVTWRDLYEFYPIMGYEKDIELNGNKYNYIINKFIKDNLSIDYNRYNILYSSKILTIHIRGSDTNIYPYITIDNYNSAYVKLPVEYYLYIIQKYNFNHILVVTDDKDISIITDLIKYTNNNNIRITIQSSTIKNDIETLISSQYLAITKSTFSIMLTPFLNINSTVFIPSYKDYILCDNLMKTLNNVIHIDISKIN